MQLVELDHNLLSSYIPGGHTRIGSQLPPESRLLTLGQIRGWKASPATARDLALLDADVVAAGGARPRHTEVHRNPVVQGDARRKYEAWTAAGRPPRGTPGFDVRTMKAAYVRRAGESLHNAGMAVDYDVAAFEFPGTGRGTDAALARFWQLARVRGFTPIIASPDIDQSEAWHFDHLGPFAAVVDLARENDEVRGNLLASVAACSLLGGHVPPDGRIKERVIQARLLLGGFWCGWVDGHIGKMTHAALKDAGFSGTIAKAKEAHLTLAWLNEAGVGVEEVERL